MQKLTKAEEDVMQLIWDLGRATVSDLIDRMEEPRPPHSTVSSVVRILERKGYVDHKAYGKTHEYFPLVDKDEYGRRSLTEVLRNYFDGSVSRLVSHLVEDQKLSAKDVEEIMKKFNEKP
ncbi:MAG: BlaI/MecI/CopY family transcriptional regulator [Saprospiraceae bacterium]|nr:BlaI/MecI/CopY family transcriptional regulator [Saprospiraceae bacterium]